MRKENPENCMFIAFMVQELLDFKILCTYVFWLKIHHFEFTFYLIDLEQMVISSQYMEPRGFLKCSKII